MTSASFSPKGPEPLQAADLVAYSSMQCAQQHLGLWSHKASFNLRELRPFLQTELGRVWGKKEGHKCDFVMPTMEALRLHGDGLRSVKADDYVQMSEAFDLAHRKMQRDRDKAARALKAKRNAVDRAK